MSTVTTYEWNKYQEMLNNPHGNPDHHVQFVSYDGKWPNLCSGKLTLNIDGEVVCFHYDHSKEEGHYDSFWASGGRCGFRNNYSESYIETGPWKINEEELPDKYKKYADEIAKVFNENVQYGCCGGCL